VSAQLSPVLEDVTSLAADARFLRILAETKEKTIPSWDFGFQNAGRGRPVEGE
jgi:hypothetical protein